MERGRRAVPGDPGLNRALHYHNGDAVDVPQGMHFIISLAGNDIPLPDPFLGREFPIMYLHLRQQFLELRIFVEIRDLQSNANTQQSSIQKACRFDRETNR